MADLEERFNAAVKRPEVEWNKRPTDEEFLVMYGFFKQATVGDVTGKKPRRIDIKAYYKYDFWKKNKGMSKEEAMEKYIELIDEMSKRYVVPEEESEK